MKEMIKKYENVTYFDVKCGNVLIHYVNEEVWVNDRLITTGMRGISYCLCADRVFYALRDEGSFMYDIETQAGKRFDHGYQDGSLLDEVAVFREGEQFMEVSLISGATRALALQMGAGGSFYTPEYIVHGSYEQNKRERILCYDRAAQRYTWQYDVKGRRCQAAPVVLLMYWFRSSLSLAGSGTKNACA